VKSLINIGYGLYLISSICDFRHDYYDVMMFLMVADFFFFSFLH